MLLPLLSPLSDGGEDFMATADAVNSETTMVAVGFVVGFLVALLLCR